MGGRNLQNREFREYITVNTLLVNQPEAFMIGPGENLQDFNSSKEKYVLERDTQQDE